MAAIYTNAGSGAYLLQSGTDNIYLDNVTIDNIVTYDYIGGLDYGRTREVTATATIDNMIDTAVTGLHSVMRNMSTGTARYTVYSDGSALLKDCWIRSSTVTATGDTELTIGGYDYMPSGYQGCINLSEFNSLYTYGGVPTEKDKKISALKSKLLIHIKSRADIIKGVDERENKAIQTLREVITETEFRKYLRYGFVLVKGKSGDTYQIFRNQSHTKIWRAGKIIEEVCVRIKADIQAPPTDNIIAFKTLIESDEAAFKTLGNVYKFKEGRLHREEGLAVYVGEEVMAYTDRLAA